MEDNLDPKDELSLFSFLEQLRKISSTIRERQQMMLEVLASCCEDHLLKNREIKENQNLESQIVKS